MTLLLRFQISILVFILSIYFASFSFAITPEYLETELLPYEQQREIEWENKYIHTIRFINSIVRVKSRYMRKVDAHNAHMVPTSKVMVLPKEAYAKYLDAAINDNMTILRAIAILGHYLKKHGVVFKIDGDLWEQVITENKINLGLFIPAKNMGLVFLIPQISTTDNAALLKVKIFYKKKFDHAFQKEVLNADLKIGYNVPQQWYCKDEKFFNGYPVTSGFIFSQSVMGFSKVRGVGGEKRGLLRFFQDLISFVVEARAIESITVNLATDVLTVQAILDTTIGNFENTKKYKLQYE